MKNNWSTSSINRFREEFLLYSTYENVVSHINLVVTFKLDFQAIVDLMEGLIITGTLSWLLGAKQMLAFMERLNVFQLVVHSQVKTHSKLLPQLKTHEKIPVRRIVVSF